MSNTANQKKPSPRQHKSFRRSVFYRAALAAPSLPPPKGGSLRQLALASIQRLQADSASPATPTTRKRSYSESDSPSALSPSNFPPLAQKIRSDLQISEESPERELLRTQPTLMKSPSPCSPRSFPPPSPLAFTPTNIQVEQVAEMSNHHSAKVAISPCVKEGVLSPVQQEIRGLKIIKQRKEVLEADLIEARRKNEERTQELEEEKVRRRKAEKFERISVSDDGEAS